MRLFIEALAAFAITWAMVAATTATASMTTGQAYNIIQGR